MMQTNNMHDPQHMMCVGEKYVSARFRMRCLSTCVDAWAQSGICVCLTITRLFWCGDGIKAATDACSWPRTITSAIRQAHHRWRTRLQFVDSVQGFLFQFNSTDQKKKTSRSQRQRASWMRRGHGPSTYWPTLGRGWEIHRTYSTQIDWNLKIQNRPNPVNKIPPPILSPLHSTRGTTLSVRVRANIKFGALKTKSVRTNEEYLSHRSSGPGQVLGI